MTPPGDDAARAFAYAWWLTGDDTAAERAVLAAARSIPFAQMHTDRAALLREVRSHAVQTRTMCPASELALLHDGQALPLDVAADLAAVPAVEARTELAHGRLEALLDTASAPFAHPERLGGLAVGNPSDVAHARTCPSCEEAQALLRRGREEVLALAPVPPTEAVRRGLAYLAPATDGTPAADRPDEDRPGADRPDEDRPGADRADSGGTSPNPRTAHDEEPPARTAPTASAHRTARATPPSPAGTSGQRRATLVLAVFVTAAVLVLLLTALAGDDAGAAAGALTGGLILRDAPRQPRRPARPAVRRDAPRQSGRPARPEVPAGPAPAGAQGVIL